MQRSNGPSSAQVKPEVAGSQASYTERAAEAAHDGVNKLHEGVDKLKERIEPGEARLREAAGNAEEALRDAQVRARERYGDVAGQTREYVREHPLTAAALAFAAGAVVVSWLRR
jgi:ElaB/YqjD/DUF883 family membrane-anchored ribosome-binding protein